ncbi:hypothetical protein RRG08_045051 [Elysia crispata]|uniref:Uncharacterized protein n=1 Tax=Elysia crispata TaxID=231223 RepID=A0AAE1CLX3_9GAST|nr:hypothetical protein RRG08_045051 [Elysia crispata]
METKRDYEAESASLATVFMSQDIPYASISSSVSGVCVAQLRLGMCTMLTTEISKNISGCVLCVQQPTSSCVVVSAITRMRGSVGNLPRQRVLNNGR